MQVWVTEMINSCGEVSMAGNLSYSHFYTNTLLFNFRNKHFWNAYNEVILCFPASNHSVAAPGTFETYGPELLIPVDVLFPCTPTVSPSCVIYSLEALTSAPRHLTGSVLEFHPATLLQTSPPFISSCSTTCLSPSLSSPRLQRRPTSRILSGYRLDNIYMYLQSSPQIPEFQLLLIL